MIILIEWNNDTNTWIRKEFPGTDDEIKQVIEAKNPSW